MTDSAGTMLPQSDKPARPPLAVVGSQISQDEILFGRVFDSWVASRLAGYLKPYRRQIYWAIAAVVAFTLTQLAIPLIIRTAIDNAVVTGSEGRIWLHIAVAIFMTIVVLNFIANLIQEHIVGRIAGHLLFDLRRAMFRHLQFVALSFMDKTEVGRLMSRLQGDVNALQEFLESSIFAIGDFILLFGIIIVLLSLDARLGALTLSVVPLLFLVRIVWLPLARKAFLRARETSSAANGALAEGVHGVRVVQELQREAVNDDLFEIKAGDNLRAQIIGSRYTNILIPIVDLLTGGAMAIIIVVGGGLVLDRSMEIGVMVAFLFYVQRFFDPIRSLTLQYSVMQRAMAAGQRIFEVLDVPLALADPDDAVDLTDLQGRIEFSNVTFGYAENQPILKNISFTAAPGETIALVGATGSGKTSIAALLRRFYVAWEGKILLDGHEIGQLREETLGRHVAMVLQQPFIFSGTILENIRYAKKDASRDTIIAAAKTVGAHDFICRLVDGYDTVLDQGGVNLSLGQRQLLSFARALVADTRILILDEATASIDSFTELEIQKALQKLLKNRTAIVIAHRLATIRGADRIVVLQDGEIIETGNHQQLLAANGLYSRLYKMNDASFDDIAGEA